MDVRKFATILIIIGLIAAGVGGVMFMGGQSELESDQQLYAETVKKVDPENYLSKSEQRESIMRPSGFEASFEKDVARMERGKMIGWGGLAIIILGAALLISAKKPELKAA